MKANIRKVMVVLLLAVLLLPMVPARAATPEISMVSVHNYNQSMSGSYDPKGNDDDTVFTIRAPYDSINLSNPTGFYQGPNYRVIFFLKGVDKNRDTIYINDYVAGSSGNVVVESGQVTVAFSPKRGGNSESYRLAVRSADGNALVTRTVRVEYLDTGTGNGSGSGGGNWQLPNQSMTLNASSNSDGFRVSTEGTRVYIDYDSSRVSRGTWMNVGFNFTDMYGSRINTSAYLTNVYANGNTNFINPSYYNPTWARGTQFSGTLNVPIVVDPSNTMFTMSIQTQNAQYQTGYYSIVWRDSASSGGQWGNGNVIVSPSRSVNIGVGQDFTFNITPTNAVITGTYFTLESPQPSVVSTATGKYLTVRGMRAGNVWINVRDSRGIVVDTVQVNVTGGSTVTPQGGGQYTVTANTLSIRTGPGTGYPIIGTLYNGNQIFVSSSANGWASVYYGNTMGYVSQNYLIYSGSGAVTGGGAGTGGWTGNWSPLPSTSGGILGDGSGTPSSSGSSSTGSSSSGNGILGNSSSYSVTPGAMMSVRYDSTGLYAGPSAQYTRLGTVYAGQQFTVQNITTEGWALITWNAGTAYVQLSAMK